MPPGGGCLVSRRCSRVLHTIRARDGRTQESEECAMPQDTVVGGTAERLGGDKLPAASDNETDPSPEAQERMTWHGAVANATAIITAEIQVGVLSPENVVNR